MKKFILVILILIIYPINVKADKGLSFCNAALDQLKNYGFSFSKYTSSKNMFSNYSFTMCGHPPNSENMIMVMLNPVRIFVVDEYSTSDGYCVMLPTRKIFKTTSDKC